MNKTAGSLIVKYIATFVAAWIAFGLLGNNPISTIALLALIGAIVNYVIGDLFILPNAGNTIASISDGILGALIAYLFAMDTRRFIANTTMFVTFGIFVMLAEYLFHIYLLRSDKVAP